MVEICYQSSKNQESVRNYTKKGQENKKIAQITNFTR